MDVEPEMVKGWGVDLGAVRVGDPVGFENLSGDEGVMGPVNPGRKGQVAEGVKPDQEGKGQNRPEEKPLSRVRDNPHRSKGPAPADSGRPRQPHPQAQAGLKRRQAEQARPVVNKGPEGQAEAAAGGEPRRKAGGLGPAQEDSAGQAGQEPEAGRQGYRRNILETPGDGRDQLAQVGPVIGPETQTSRFILSLSMVERASHPVFGTSSCAPTLYTTDTASTNVIPGEATLFVDWRNVPGERAEVVVGRLEKLLTESLDPGAAGSIRLLEVRQTTYTGVEVSFPDEMPDFETPADNPYARRALKVLADLFAARAAPYYWRFTTDAGHFARVGTVALGFAPGDDALPHTYEERVGLTELVDGLAGYIGLALGLGGEGR